ncbi:MAG: LysR family transcriptional regulator [Pseudomonadota bacterium]
MIDLNLITTFLEVTKQKKLNLAAQKLFLTQSALSQRIKSLEVQIGSTLFYRKRSGMELNQFGKEFYEICADLDRNVDLLNSWLDGRKNHIGGQIRIATVSGFMSCVSPVFLRKFLKKYPEVRVNISDKSSEEVENEVLRGAYDVGIIVGQCKKQSLKTQKLCDNHVYMVCSPDYFLAKKKDDISPNDFDKSRFVWKISRSLKSIMEILKINYHDRNVDIFVSDMDACKKYVLAGIGVALVAKMFIDEELKNGKLVILGNYKINWPAYLISRSEKYEPPVISIFKKEFVKFCAGKDY